MKTKKSKVDQIDKWEKVTKKEVLNHRKAYKAKMGRPFKDVSEKGIRISLIIEPKTLEKFKLKSIKEKKPYQTLINEILKKAS